MPKQPNVRGVVVGEDLWRAARAGAALRGTTVSAVVREALRRFVDEVEADRQRAQQRPAGQ